MLKRLSRENIESIQRNLRSREKKTNSTQQQQEPKSNQLEKQSKDMFAKRTTPK